MTSALLRLPLSVPRREKVARVDAIIAELVRASAQRPAPAAPFRSTSQRWHGHEVACSSG